MAADAGLARELSEHRRYALLLGVLWTLLVAAAGVWTGESSRDEAESAALVSARSGFEKDMLYRRWASSHGGVYAEVAGENQPNPLLENYPERDIVTPSGRKLTLVNPAYMTRQVFDLGMATEGPKAHITSLNPVRGENAPDQWEEKALTWFSRGAREYSGVAMVDNVESMRYMGALAVDSTCGECHASQGFQVGEVRGGISVSVPLKPYLDMAGAEHSRELRALAALWLFGILGLLILNADLARKSRERATVEETLAKDRRAYREVLENLRLISVVLDPAGKVVFVNDYFTEVTGYTREETTGRDWFAVIHPGEPEVRAGFEKASRSGRVIPHHRTVIACKDGSRRTVLWSNTMLPDGEGKVSLVTSIGQDITDRLAAEERQKLLATALDRAAEAVVLTDGAGRITYVNSSFAEQSGIDREAAAGMPVSALLAESNDRATLKAVREATAAGSLWERRLYCKAGGGRRLLCEVSGAPLLDVSGARVGYVHVARDVTLRTEMEERLAQAQRMEALGTLAGGIAHDFNNLLTAMQGWAELTLLCKIDSSARENVGELMNATARAAELVRQILAFSRKGGEAEAAPMAPAPLLKEALKLIRATVPASVAMKLELADTARIFATPGELHRLAVNLCTNAAHAMPGGGTLHVRLDEVETGGQPPLSRGELKPGRYVRLTVKDDGVGMPGDVKTRIFEPFFTTKGEGKGTGMGLAVVHTIVAARGGAIFVDSHPGAGSTFEVLFPALEHAQELKEPESSGADAVGLRVLFVDDEHSVARLAEKALARYGHKVTAFTDPLAALGALKGDPGGFDALITDMTMPAMRGDELAAAARAVRPDLPLILCTGYSEKIAGRDAESLGVDAVELKPLTPMQLHEILVKVASARANS